jgi:ABC-type polar amino acid transport system ATPase subunit
MQNTSIQVKGLQKSYKQLHVLKGVYQVNRRVMIRHLGKMKTIY